MDTPKIIKSISLNIPPVSPVSNSAKEKQILDDGLTEHSIQSAAKAAALEVNPEADLHATADYRRRLIAVLTQQAVLKAKERARENS